MAWESGWAKAKFGIMERIKQCQEQLLNWNWKEFGNVNKGLKKKKKGEAPTIRILGQFTWESGRDSKG